MSKQALMRSDRGRSGAVTSVLVLIGSIGLFAGMLAAGCARSSSSGGTTPAGGGNASQAPGQALTQAAADAIVIGQHTKEQVTAQLGNATSITQMPPGSANGCVEQWMYLQTYQVGSNMVADALVVDFNAAGVVCDRAYSQSQSPIP